MDNITNQVLDLENGKKYFMIVDNKMSSRDVKQNSILAGLQLQLLIVQLAEGGLHAFDDHSSGTSRPSISARPMRAARTTMRRASSSSSAS